MKEKQKLDYVLNEGEIAELPEALREQRAAHINYLEEVETVHPLIDGGASVTALSRAIFARTVIDEVTRRVLKNNQADDDQNREVQPDDWQTITCGSCDNHRDVNDETTNNGGDDDGEEIQGDD